MRGKMAGFGVSALCACLWVDCGLRTLGDPGSDTAAGGYAEGAHGGVNGVVLAAWSHLGLACF